MPSWIHPPAWHSFYAAGLEQGRGLLSYLGFVA